MEFGNVSASYVSSSCSCRREVVTEQFTRDRLSRIAGKLGIAHGGVYESGLTWLAPPEILLELADATVTIGR